MIAAAVSRVAQELNQTLQRRAQSTENMVVVSSLLEADGQPAAYAADKLAVFLVNLEREAAPNRAMTRVDGGAGRTALSQPPIYLNLLVMFAANFSGGKYPEALKFISHTAAFFQGRPTFDHQNTPDLDAGIERLTLEIENLSIADLGNLWGILGGRYLPSLLYRMRMVVIDSDQLAAQEPQVVRTGVKLAPGLAGAA